MDHGTTTATGGLDRPSNVRRDKGGRWLPGSVPNPRGKLPGTRHRTTILVENMLAGEIEGITRKAIELANAGDVTAIKLCFERTVPARRDRTIAFELPKMESASDAVAAMAYVADAVARGEITPGEAAEFSKVIDTFARTIEVRDLAARVAKLEEKR